MLRSTHKPAQQVSPSVSTPLPPGWTEHTAPTGHPYYYNAETKQSTYTRPVAPTQFLPSQYHIPAWYGATSIPPPYPVNNPPYTNHQAFPAPQEPYHLQQSTRGRCNFRGGHTYQDRRRRDHQEDRPKSKHPIPGCAPWVLVKTKLGRRFVHNLETNESFWRFPKDVMQGVVEYDIQERKKRERRENGEASEDENEAAVEAAEVAAAETRQPHASPTPAQGEVRHESSDEYEEVEVTDDEAEQDDDENHSKRQRPNDAPAENQPVEFNEEDIAYQLTLLGQSHGLDPGEYGDAGDDWEEGAEGLPLTEEDSTLLFADLLNDAHISPYTPFESLLSNDTLTSDARYTVLPNTKRRREVWSQWSKAKIAELKEQREKAEKSDPRIGYLAFLETNVTGKLYWAEFKRKFRKEAEMKEGSGRVPEKEKERLYREFVARMKLPQATLNADLSALLRSIPLAELNGNTLMDALPGKLRADIRYYSLPAQIRDPMIETYISTLAPAPEREDVSQESSDDAVTERTERERRERALREREKRVMEEKRRQRRELDLGKGRLREEEMEVEKAMRVGKEGLRAQLEVLADGPDSGGMSGNGD